MSKPKEYSLLSKFILGFPGGITGASIIGGSGGFIGETGLSFFSLFSNINVTYSSLTTCLAPFFGFFFIFSNKLKFLFSGKLYTSIF